MLDPVRYREHRVPLDGIEETVEAVIELYGGEITGRDPDRVSFQLAPDRESGGIDCELSWKNDPDGTAGQGIVVFEGGRELAPPKLQRILLLIVGAAAGLLSLMWPFFPDLGPILVVSAVIAIATFLLTLRMTPGGVGGDMLQKIARTQRMSIDEPDLE